MTYNKKEIMTQAWIWFKNEDLVLADIEWVSYDDNEKSFGVCLKAAWAKAKEDAEEEKDFAKVVASSEELKAWNWAERKLNVKSDLSDKTKYNDMLNIDKESFGLSVWQKAIKAVSLYARTAA